MRSILSSALLAVIAVPIALCASGDAQVAEPPKIVIVRHRETSDAGDNLSCQGLNRALQLPAVLLGKFGAPAYTYVPALKVGKSTDYVRMPQTVTPLAVQRNLVANSKFTGADVVAIARDARKRYGLVLIVWDRGHIPAPAPELGVRAPPSWSNDDFDSIWVIGFEHGSVKLTIDAGGLAPQASCPF